LLFDDVVGHRREGLETEAVQLLEVAVEQESVAQCVDASRHPFGELVDPLENFFGELRVTLPSGEGQSMLDIATGFVCIQGFEMVGRDDALAELLEALGAQGGTELSLTEKKALNHRTSFHLEVRQHA
jgi:hypothetical protein